MKVRPLICLLPLLFLASFSCTQQPEKKATTEQKSRGNAVPAKKQPARVIYLAGEIVSINLKSNMLIIMGKDGGVEVFTNKNTIIKTGNDDIRLSDISSGNTVTVRYVSVEGKNIAKSMFIAQENREESTILKSGYAPSEPQSVIPTAEPQKIIPPIQPPVSPEKQ